MQLGPSAGARFWQSDGPPPPLPDVYAGKESPRYAGFEPLETLAGADRLPVDGERRYLGRLLHDSGPTSELHGLLMVVAFDVPAAQTQDVENWYVEEHVDLLMKGDGWLRVRQYRVERFAGPVRWTHIAIHELRDHQALNTPEREAARTTAWRARLQRDPWFDQAGRWFYEPLRTLGRPDMRLAGLDLNLLVALEVLLTERSVSVAADKVHLSQSAMSGALARLRDYFNDELLVNVGGRMQPTQVGEALVEPVRNALELIRSTITERGQFQPDQSDRRFNVVMSDYAAEVLLPAVLRAIGRSAPEISLNIIQPAYDSIVRLERGEIDLLITVEGHLSASHPHELLFEDDFVVLVAKEHPWIGDSLTEADYLRAHHVVATFGHRLTHEQVHMGDAQGRRRVTAICPSFNLVPLLVAGSERIATLHRRHAEIYARMAPLRMLPLPEPIPPIQEHIQWHAMRRGDAGLLWLRDLFLTCARA